MIMALHQAGKRPLPETEMTKFQYAGGCFTSVSRVLQNNLAKIHNARNHFYGENFKLKIRTCAQSMALGTHSKFQLEVLIRSMISAIHKLREYLGELAKR